MSIDKLLTANEAHTHGDILNKINTIIDALNIGSLAFVGNAFIADSATAVTPISLTANVEAQLTNDALGAANDDAHLPVGVTSIWNSSTNQIDFSELEVGDMVDIAIDLIGTTTSPNQEYDIYVRLAAGTADEEDIQWTWSQIKSAGTRKLNRMNGILIKNANIKNTPATIYLKTDSAGSVVINGFYFKIIRRGENIVSNQYGY